MFSLFSYCPHIVLPVDAPKRCAFLVAVIASAVATTGSPALGQTTNKLRSGPDYAAQQVQMPAVRPVATKTVKPTVQNPPVIRQTTVVEVAEPVVSPGKSRQASQKASHSQDRPASPVRRAAHGELDYEQPPVQFRKSEVAPVSHVCGCDHCAAAYHAGHIGHGEVVCGAEPVCGFEVESGFEVSCGFEQGCGGSGCDAGACNDCIGIHLPILRIDWRRFDFFAGVNSFTGPANHASDGTTRRGGSGSFGFYEGFNAGRSLNRLFGLDLSSQVGVRATQSSLSGAEFTQDARNQVFVTGGLFRRVDFGLQYGLVVDYLYDDWWYRNNLMQLRGELSWNDGCGRELGYQFMASSDNSTSRTHLIGAGGVVTTGTATFEPTNQHRLFLRGQTARGASYMAFAGGTEQGDGLLGGLLTSSFHNRIAIQGGVTYLIPGESNRSGGYSNESWNISMGLVFRPGGKQGAGRYCRPMFDVADNGTFMVDRVR